MVRTQTINEDSEEEFKEQKEEIYDYTYDYIDALKEDYK